MAELQFLFSALSFIFAVNATAVTLDSSADSVCPGDTVVFTCATDTGQLIWKVDENIALLNNDTTKLEQSLSIFELNLTSKTGNTIVSTATVHDVHLDYNGTNISCTDSVIPHLSGINKEFEIVISGPPSPPLNLTLLSCNLSSVTIGWVAPPDMPLCVHSYTVTVRNSCNSSQVMVYNTTDNRSSLSITDLTSDGDYLVTVAGRDGAGRLGQEISLKQNNVVTNISYQLVSMNKELYGALLSWKIGCAAGQINFLVCHNVTLDQSPIEVNRPSVTLYNVQLWETYAVNITPINCGFGLTKQFYFQAEAATEQTCNTASTTINKSLSEGHIASIIGSVVLVLVITCYLMMCVFTKYNVPANDDSSRCSGAIDHLTLLQFEDMSKNKKDKCVKDIVAEGSQPLPEYDYVCHQ